MLSKCCKKDLEIENGEELHYLCCACGRVTEPVYDFFAENEYVFAGETKCNYHN